jgi:hypothetical protein
MTPADVSVVARMHQKSMGSSSWGRLGTPFLEALYRSLLRHRAFLAFVYVEDGSVRGFIAGSDDAPRLMRETLLRRGLWLVRPTLSGVRRDPALLRTLLTTIRYFRRSAPSSDVVAESFFCSFETDLRGRRVAGHINKVLFDLLAHRGHSRVKVTTEVDNEGANRQLRSWGFEDSGTFDFYDKRMVVYVLDLAGSPRVNPHVWCP